MKFIRKYYIYFFWMFSFFFSFFIDLDQGATNIYNYLFGISTVLAIIVMTLPIDNKNSFENDIDESIRKD